MTCQTCYKEAGKQEVARNMKVLGIIEFESQKGQSVPGKACTQIWMVSEAEV